MTTPLIERFRDRLPVSEATPVVSLGEGSTPLLAAPRLSQRLGLELWLKWEGANPTGSYKDRGMTLAVSKALERGAAALVCASTGNTSASMAAYAARAGLPAVVLVPQGAIAGAKLAQARALGARVLEVRGSFDQALQAARELGQRGTHVVLNSGYNADRVEGQKTAVLEIVEELGGTPDAFVIPYGGGGNTKAYARGLGELGLETPLHSVESANRPRTLASAIRIAEPVHRPEVEASGAQVHAVDDDEIVAAWLELAATEGVFCEPSSAAGLAFLRRDAASLRGRRVVATLTGHGLKDPAVAEARAPRPLLVDPDPEAIAAAAR